MQHFGASILTTHKTVIDLFVRRSLVRRSAEGWVSLHDLQSDYARSCCRDLPALHATLVEAYGATCDGSWSRGPDDGYFFKHLPQHLAAADRIEELKSVLCDYDWLAAKLRATDVAAMLADYDLIASDLDLAIVAQALRLSIRALAHDRSELPGQLLGRLRVAGRPAIEALLARAEQGPGRTWLRPRFASLTPPDGPLRQILVGHTEGVSAVAAFADGSRALSGSVDNTLRLWDLATGETLRILEGHTSSVTAVAVFADGGRALSGSAWTTPCGCGISATGGTLRTLEGHTGGVTAVAVFADGSRALSGSRDNTLRLWDLATGESLRTLEGHTDGVTAVAVLGRRQPRPLRLLGQHAAAVGSRDRREPCAPSKGTPVGSPRWRCWPTAAAPSPALTTTRCGCGISRPARPCAPSKGTRVGVTAVAVLADGRRALSGSWDNTLRLWDLATGETLRTLEGHTGGVNAVAVLADGSRALSGS